MKLDNIMKVGDLHQKDVTNEVVNFLTTCSEPVYRDTVLKEHLFDVNGILDDPESNCSILPSAKVKKKLTDINKLLSENDCAYLRIIYT